MQFIPLGAIQRPDGVTPEEWRTFLAAYGGSSVYLRRINGEIFACRFAHEHGFRYGRLEELLPLFAALPLSVERPKDEHLVTKLPPSRGPDLSTIDIDDLLSGL